MRLPLAGNGKPATLRRMGRPAKPPAERKTNQLRMRLTDEEAAAYKRASKRAGLSYSAWARQILSRAAADRGADR